MTNRIINDLKATEAAAAPSAESEGRETRENILTYMAQKHADLGKSVPAEQVVQALMSFVRPKGGSVQLDTTRALVRYAVTLINLADGRLTIPNIARVMQSRARGEVTRKWKETSYQSHLFRRAEWRMKNHAPYREDRDVQMVWEDTQRYWLKELPAHDRPESSAGNFVQSCVGEFTAMSDEMMKNAPLQRLFCQGSYNSAPNDPHAN